MAVQLSRASSALQAVAKSTRLVALQPHAVDGATSALPNLSAIMHAAVAKPTAVVAAGALQASSASTDPLSYVPTPLPYPSNGGKGVLALVGGLSAVAKEAKEDADSVAAGGVPKHRMDHEAWSVQQGTLDEWGTVYHLIHYGVDDKSNSWKLDGKYLRDMGPLDVKTAMAVSDMWTASNASNPKSHVGGFSILADSLKDLAGDVAAVSLAPVTGGVSLGIAPSAPKAVQDATHDAIHAATTPQGIATIGNVVGIALAPFTGGASLAIGAGATAVAAGMQHHANQQAADDAAAAAAATAANPLAGLTTNKALLYGGLAIVAALILREVT